MKEAKNPKKSKRVSLTNEQLRVIITKKLPILIKKEPILKDYLARLVKDKFADKEETKDEIKALLEEIRNLRLESERKWEENEKRWEENQRRWEENEKRWEENQRRWEENEKRWEENQRRWEENQRRWEENEKRWEENQKRLDEQSKILLQHSKTLEFLVEEVKKLKIKFDTGIGALGARWGIKSEASFRNALKGILEEYFPVKVERYVKVDTEGEVFEGIPGQTVELDIIIRDSKLILAEIKSSVSRADVWLFEKKVRFYERMEGKRADRKIIISPMIEPKAEPLIKQLGIKAYTSIPDDESDL